MKKEFIILFLSLLFINDLSGQDFLTNCKFELSNIQKYDQDLENANASISNTRKIADLGEYETAIKNWSDYQFAMGRISVKLVRLADLARINQDNDMMIESYIQQRNLLDTKSAIMYNPDQQKLIEHYSLNKEEQFKREFYYAYLNEFRRLSKVGTIFLTRITAYLTDYSNYSIRSQEELENLRYITIDSYQRGEVSIGGRSETEYANARFLRMWLVPFFENAKSSQPSESVGGAIETLVKGITSIIK